MSNNVIFDNGGRFITAGPFDSEMPDIYIIIKDYTWWSANEEKIYEWMDASLPQGRGHHQGMVVTVPNERDVLAFLLRWS